MYKKQLFLKAVTCLVEGRPLFVSGMEYRYYHRGDVIHNKNCNIKMVDSGIFRKCNIADVNRQEPILSRWIRYCRLDEIDMLFDGLASWEQKHLMVQIDAARALRSEPHFTSCGTAITVNAGTA